MFTGLRRCCKTAQNLADVSKVLQLLRLLRSEGKDQYVFVQFY